MTSEEMRLNRKKILNQRMAQKYRSIVLDEKVCFLLADGLVCRIGSLSEPYDALVIEYADNMQMAEKGIFGEDGDLFYMDEMDEDTMFAAMVHEIENVGYES